MENATTTAKEFNPKDLKQDDSGKYVYPLIAPFTYGSELIKEIRLIKPKAKHIRNLKVSNMTVDEGLKIIGTLSGNTDSFIDELEMSDTMNLLAFFNSFM